MEAYIHVNKKINETLYPRTRLEIGAQRGSKRSSIEFLQSCQYLQPA